MTVIALTGQPNTTAATSSAYNSTTAAPADGPALGPGPLARLLTASLFVAPLLYLAVDTIYAARGWGDGLAGALHVVGAIAYGLVILRVAFWLPARSRLTAALVFVGVIGCVGNAAYGFEAIHMSVGDLQLVDRAGPANIIKPIGLFFPLSLALAAWALARLGHRWQSWLLGVAVVAWPVAHIGNLPPVAVAVNVALVAVFGSIAWGLRRS
ncbi:MAG TPA: hypothetical protein PLA46_03890 [Phycicoccus sp.]|nr:hypothetical protein [Phycicoccus sp.]HQV90700.1 hypothetical protein [Phycicoccus sp.]HQY96241.1 hypothetical protein [Phycicoccus sp.]